jgi:Zeta toxin
MAHLRARREIYADREPARRCHDELEVERAWEELGRRKRVHIFDINAEVDRLFDDSSIPKDGEPPAAIIFIGGPGAGKTTIRKQKYSSGYVSIDAGDIFVSLSQGKFYPFPDGLEEPLNFIGQLVADRALSERRNIVIELIGADVKPIEQLVEALKTIGYKPKGVVIMCEFEEAHRRNLARSDDNISAYYAEPFHRAWIMNACRSIAEKGEA